MRENSNPLSNPNSQPSIEMKVLKSFRPEIKTNKQTVQTLYETGTKYYLDARKQPASPTDYSLAMEFMTQAAVLGLAEAQNALGQMYFDGLPDLQVVPNYIEAFHWFVKANNQNNMNAQYMLGLMCQEGLSVLHDDKEAMAERYFSKASRQGCMKAKYKMGEMIHAKTTDLLSKFLLWYYKVSSLSSPQEQRKYLNSDVGKNTLNNLEITSDHQCIIFNRLNKELLIGDVMKFIHHKQEQKSRQEFKRAFSLFNLSAAQGYAPALKMLEDERYKGLAKQNIKKYKHYVSVYRTEATAAEKQYQLGMDCYTKAMGTAGTGDDFFSAINCVNLAATSGLEVAKSQLGKMYFDGLPSLKVRPNYKEAFKWFEQAAKRPDITAGVHLGIMYRDGLGVKQDSDKAILWLAKAAKLDYKQSDRELNQENNSQGECSRHADGYTSGFFSSPKAQQTNSGGSRPTNMMTQVNEALEALNNMAEQKNAQAQYTIGLLYYRGEVGPIDYQKALKCWGKAARLEYAPAVYQLGVMYLQGDGELRKDLSAAHRLFERAANHKQPYALAEFMLGEMYSQGQNVDQDVDKAIDWYKKAAAHGCEPAQSKLAHMRQRLSYGYGY
jgi:uncharacterized protein